MAEAQPASGRTEVFLAFPPDADLCVQYTGQEACAPGHLWQGIRNHFLIHYVLAGEGRVMTAGGVRRLSAGDGFLFFPGQRCWYQADTRRPWTYAWVGFAGREADETVRGLGFTEERTVWRARDAGLGRSLRHLVRSATDVPVRSLRLTGLLYLLLDSIGRLPGDAPPDVDRRPPAPVARAFRFVELHYGQRIGVADMARHAGMERTYFSTVFRRATGQTPAAYLLAFRMARAEALLAETDLSVKEISSSLGYGDYFGFARCFKRVHGRTPSEHRRRSRAMRAGRPASQARERPRSPAPSRRR